jgi:transcriptional regulator with XRE-family HTH domain
MKSTITKPKVARVVSTEAKRLREFRKAEGLTQTEFAVIVGKDQATVQRYESGEYVISVEIVRIMHERLLLNFTWFFTGKGPRKIVPEKTNLVTDVKSIELNQNLLIDQVAGLKLDFIKLHNAFYELKQQMKI